MQRLNDEIKKIIDTMEIFPFATASNDGTVNVVPIKFLQVIDDTTLWITDNYFKKTFNNLQTNPQAAFFIWSKELKKSYQIKGTIEIFQSGADYEKMKTSARAIKTTLPAKSLMVMHVTEVFDCMPR
jgi:predicted pyridoxine 5'-phosphate oxidase superfamily flavin-nucleotide-binding protein